MNRRMCEKRTVVFVIILVALMGFGIVSAGLIPNFGVISGTIIVVGPNLIDELDKIRAKIPVCYDLVEELEDQSSDHDFLEILDDLKDDCSDIDREILDLIEESLLDGKLSNKERDRILDEIDDELDDLDEILEDLLDDDEDYGEDYDLTDLILHIEDIIYELGLLTDFIDSHGGDEVDELDEIKAMIPVCYDLVEELEDQSSDHDFLDILDDLEDDCEDIDEEIMDLIEDALSDGKISDKESNRILDEIDDELDDLDEILEDLLDDDEDYGEDYDLDELISHIEAMISELDLLIDVIKNF